MAFITAGMGGGTGTGAAPVIARAAKEQGILTVGVVTKPFHFEGARRMQTAERGIELLAKHVDTLIVIPNQNLFRVANEKTTFAAAFAMADQVLYSGVASITELMTKEGLINLDFADVRAIMSEMGKAMMGTGEASGEKRAIEAAEAAISNPLLDDVSMRGARGLLISITGGPDLTLYEVDEAATRIREEVDPEANIILGATFDDSLEGTMRVSVVATGLALEALQGCETRDDAEHQEDVRRPRTARSSASPASSRPGEEADAASADGRRGRCRSPAAGEPSTEAAEARRPTQMSRWLRTGARSARRPSARTAHAAIEEFPPIAQRQIAAQQNRIENIADMRHARRRACSSALPVSALAARKKPRQRRNGSRMMAAPQRQASSRIQPRMQPPPQAACRSGSRRRPAGNSGVPAPPGQLIENATKS